MRGLVRHHVGDDTLPACFIHINSDDGVQYRRVLVTTASISFKLRW